jgi:uncharacterized protein (TIGR02145 family)
MKKILFLIVVFCSLKVNAQNITFAGTGLSTVKVENLTKCSSLTLNADDILTLSETVGVTEVNQKDSSELKIYPNPMIDNSTLVIFPPVSGDAIISVFDVAGKPLIQIKSFLENYIQEFKLSGLDHGFFLINVKGKTYQFSGKFMSLGRITGTPCIEKVGNNIHESDKNLSNIDSKGVQDIYYMLYSTGDRLKFTGVSGNYSTVMTVIPSSDTTITFDYFSPCTDKDNINYPVVKIGTQVWMAENLSTTKYNNGELIGTTNPATLDIHGETTPKYQWAYQANESYVVTYGRLYTWYTIADSRGVCPVGWHIPNESEWSVLITLLGGENIAGSKLKETCPIHWNNANTDATNESGFTALGEGWRTMDGGFYGIMNGSTLWSSDEYSFDPKYAKVVEIHASMTVGEIKLIEKKYGLAVRCIKDN